MKHYAGLDVSVKETAICIVDESGLICRETKVVSHPEDLSKVLMETGFCIERIGLEAGPLSQWLFEGMARAGLPVICVETRHTKAFLRAQINKSDRNDARGIAQMMRVNLYRPVHVKTLASQKRRALLRARKLLQEKAIAIENDIRGLLRNFGLKVGIVGAAVAAMLKTIFAQETKVEAETQWEIVVDALREKQPKLGALMDSSRDDILAYMSFPREHWAQIASTNPLERVNREVKRRADVIGIFPNDEAIVRLVGALMLETNDEWAVARRYMSLETLARVTDNPTVRLPAVAS